MIKARRKSLFWDRFHKGFVFTCIGLTLYGCTFMGLKAYNYYTQIKPAKKQKELIETKELLAEGSSDKIKNSSLKN